MLLCYSYGISNVFSVLNSFTRITLVILTLSSDRKKDLVKLSHGEYVSLGKIEATLKHSHYVENCCVYGDSKESYLIALIVPNQPYLTQLSKEVGISGSFEELCGNSQIIEKVVKDIQVVSKESELMAAFVDFVFHDKSSWCLFFIGLDTDIFCKFKLILLKVLVNYNEVLQSNRNMC